MNMRPLWVLLLFFSLSDNLLLSLFETSLGPFMVLLSVVPFTPLLTCVHSSLILVVFFPV